MSHTTKRINSSAQIKYGYDGKELGVAQQWTLTGAFLYSLTVITTIGVLLVSLESYASDCRLRQHVVQNASWQNHYHNVRHYRHPTHVALPRQYR